MKKLLPEHRTARREERLDIDGQYAILKNRSAPVKGEKAGGRKRCAREEEGRCGFAMRL